MTAEQARRLKEKSKELYRIDSITSIFNNIRITASLPGGDNFVVVSFILSKTEINKFEELGYEVKPSSSGKGHVISW